MPGIKPIGEEEYLLERNGDITKELLLASEPQQSENELLAALEKRGCEESTLNVNSYGDEAKVCKTSGENRLYILWIDSKIAQIGKRNICKIREVAENEEDEFNTKNDNDSNSKTALQTSEFNSKQNTTMENPRDIAEKTQEWMDSSGETTCSDTSTKQKQRVIKKRGRYQQSALRTKVLKTIGFPSPSPSTKTFFKMSDEIMMALQVFRDNGEWDLFDKKMKDLTSEYKDNKEAKVIILLEQSTAACYQNKLEESEKMIEKAIEDAKGTENSAFLTRRAHLYYSGVYRKRRHQTGNADKHTEIAEKMCDQSLTLDLTFITYERASVLMDFIATFPNHKPNIKEEAKANLKRCIDGSMILEQDTDQLRYIKKNQFAFIKMAMLLLDCRTAAGRTKEVSQCDIDEAKDCLDALRHRYWNGIAQGEKLQYYLAMTDLKWRQKNFQEAHKFASTALKMAEGLGFRTEIKPAKDRLAEIEVKLQEMPGERLPGYGIKPVCDNDSAPEFESVLSDNSHFGGSSCCESDDPLTPLL